MQICFSVSVGDSLPCLQQEVDVTGAQWASGPCPEGHSRQPQGRDTSPFLRSLQLVFFLRPHLECRRKGTDSRDPPSPVAPASSLPLRAQAWPLSPKWEVASAGGDAERREPLRIGKVKCCGCCGHEPGGSSDGGHSITSGRCVDKQHVVRPHSVAIHIMGCYSALKEGVSDPRCNVDEPRKHDAERTKPDVPVS